MNEERNRVSSNFVTDDMVVIRCDDVEANIWCYIILSKKSMVRSASPTFGTTSTIDLVSRPIEMQRSGRQIKTNRRRPYTMSLTSRLIEVRSERRRWV